MQAWAWTPAPTPNSDDHITFRVKRKGKLSIGPSFFHTMFILDLSGRAWKPGLSWPIRAHHLHGCMPSFSCFICLPVAFSIRIYRARPWSGLPPGQFGGWVIGPVGKAKGMHGETRTFQFSAFGGLFWILLTGSKRARLIGKRGCSKVRRVWDQCLVVINRCRWTLLVMHS